MKGFQGGPYEQLLHEAAEYLGSSIESYTDPMNKRLYIRLENGEEFHLDEIDIMTAHNPEARIVAWLLEIINSKLRKTIDAGEKSAEALGDTARVMRIHEINAELDILRGRVPTPKGYTVNMKRAKELMTELKRLTEKI